MSGWAAAFTAPMTITALGEHLLRCTRRRRSSTAHVTVKISTDGKILIIGQLNFAANNLSISGRLYADLSHISQGAATVLFLADAPDQVRVLTIYGKLQMGFRNADGDEVAFTVPDEPPAEPDVRRSAARPTAARSRRAS